MKRERIDLRPGDRVRCPDRPTAAWHVVQRIGRRKNGTRYIVIRRSRLGQALGLPLRQPLEWAMLKACGYGLRRAKAAQVITATEPVEVKT